MKKPYIIILEDDPNLGIIYQKSLENAGYETALDKDGSQFLQWVKKRKPDLLILDMHTPFSWGPDAIAALKENEATRTIPRLVTTADILIANRLKAEGEHVLVKPVSVGRLIEHVHKLIRPQEG